MSDLKPPVLPVEAESAPSFASQEASQESSFGDILSQFEQEHRPGKGAQQTVQGTVVGVNPDRRESNLDVIPDDALALWRGNPRNPRSERASSAAGRGTQREEPFGLWWYIMMLALVAALSESRLRSFFLML